MLKGVPKSHVYRILRSGEVRVNKGRVGPDARLAIGDVVRVPPVRTAPAPCPAQVCGRVPRPRSCSRTRRSIVVDKPSGLAVHGGSGIAAGLIEQMRAARPEARFLELVHRLDRDTSGVMLIAKKRPRWSGCTEQLREGAFRQALSGPGPWPLARREAPRAACAAQVLDEGRRAPGAGGR